MLFVISLILSVSRISLTDQDIPGRERTDPIHYLTDAVNQMESSFNRQIGNISSAMKIIVHKVENLERNYDQRGNVTVIESLTNRVNNLEKVTNRSNHVAFYARLSHSVSLGDQQAVVFNDVITNEGGGYNVYDGAFVAPISGTYQFTAAIMGSQGETIDVSIVRNGNVVANIFGAEPDGVMATQTVIIDIRPGDRIWVRNEDSSGKHLYSKPNETFCTFTGYRLY